MIQPSLLLRGRQVLTALARLTCLWACVTVPAIAFAEDAPDSEREAEYQQLITYALDEYERGSWEESAALFRRAHELLPSARTLRGLGLATYEARRYAESIRHLRAALSDERRPLNEKQRDEVKATLERARLFVGHLVIDLTPPDAQVTINGRVAEPEADGAYMVDSGWVDVEASAPDYAMQNKRMRIGGGEKQRIRLHLVSTLPVAEAAAARTSEASTAAPASSPSAALAGSSTFAPRAGAGTLPPADAEPESTPFQTWKWVAGGAAVVALGVGGTMLAMQKIEAPAYERECTQSATQPADCESRHKYLSSTLWNGSIISLSLGGALTALAVTLFVLDAHADKSGHEGRTTLSCGGMGTLGVACSAKF